MRVAEPGHVGAREVHHRVDALATVEIRSRLILDLHRVIARHVRTVAPDNARQGCLQPPPVPRPANDALRLPVNLGKRVRLLVAETLGLVRVDPAETEDRRDHVGALGKAGTSSCSNVEIAGGVDDDVTHDRLPPGLRLADHALDCAVAHDGLGEP